jgi:hypothetical protein
MPHAEIAHLPIVAIVVVGRGHSPLRTLSVPHLAVLGALPSTMDGDIGWCLLTAAWGRLPTSRRKMKFSRLTVGGVLGGDAAKLLSGVPKNVIVFAQAWVPGVVFVSRARVLLASLSMSLGFSTVAPLP